MKNILYEVVTWTWQKYFGSISLSLHRKKADQRAMSDSRVQREITLFQMTFEWKRASRVMAVVPVSSFIDFCPEIQDGRVGCTTNSTKTKQNFGLRSRVKRGFPNRQTRMSSWGRRRTATNTGLLSELKIARSLWLASLLYVMHAAFLSPTMHLVPYNLAMNDDFYSLLNRTPWRHWGRRRRRGPRVNFKCKRVFYFSAMNKPSWHSYFAK